MVGFGFHDLNCLHVSLVLITGSTGSGGSGGRGVAVQSPNKVL